MIVVEDFFLSFLLMDLLFRLVVVFFTYTILLDLQRFCIMDATMEELWRKFYLLKEEKGVLAVSSQEVALFKDHA